MEELNLKKVKAFTIYSSDNEKTASAKGVYKSFEVASIKAKKSRWYDSDGSVEILNGIYQAKNSELYRVSYIGQFTDVSESLKEEIMKNIKGKLTAEELLFLGVS